MTDMAPPNRPQSHDAAKPRTLTKAELAAELQRVKIALYGENGRYTGTEPTRIVVMIHA